MIIGSVGKSITNRNILQIIFPVVCRNVFSLTPLALGHSITRDHYWTAVVLTMIVHFGWICAAFMVFAKGMSYFIRTYFSCFFAGGMKSPARGFLKEKDQSPRERT